MSAPHRPIQNQHEGQNILAKPSTSIPDLLGPLNNEFKRSAHYGGWQNNVSPVKLMMPIKVAVTQFIRPSQRLNDLRAKEIQGIRHKAQGTRRG
jgi:hypothetical protein